MVTRIQIQWTHLDGYRVEVETENKIFSSSGFPNLMTALESAIRNAGELLRQDAIPREPFPIEICYNRL